ncbi:MAG: AMP-binding protein [Natronospirillum sp.]|uniref:class I adenylate-forming enzyme family protein n=1 Tax=Natronospirillum sp. TaxID=2812955 RepID=UPI0025E4D697|nr:AMP-binding protein [Natronospirillum sp.]MCH8552530.1 AMP-binding protein [Natronospirillum sp.]
MAQSNPVQAPDELIFGRWASDLVAELPDRLSKRVHDNARRFPDQPALVEGEVRWSYRALSAQIYSVKIWLEELGLRPGDRLMAVSENCRALVVLLLAATEMDASVAIINPRLSASEIDAIAADCLPRRVVFTSGASTEAAAHGRRHEAEPFVHESLGELMIGGLNKAEPDPVYAEGHRQTAALIYTSGTTGKPKGVMLSHRGILYIASISGGMRHLTQGQRVYGVLPMSHVFGLSSVCMGSLYNGACLYAIPRFAPDDLLDALEQEAITVLQGVPAMYAKTLEHLRTHQRTLKAEALIYISAGGSPLDLETKQRVEKVFNLTLHNGYGLTEASPTISQTRIDQHAEDNTVGRVLPLLEYRLLPLTEDTRESETAPGELWVRGPNVMLGYYRQPEATAACLTADGWLNTGDIARVDDEGQLYIVSRSKELIIRSGFNIYPPDVEAALNRHPAVMMSAVVGRQVAGNEEVIAYVQCDPGAELTEEALRDFVADQLAPYKRPSRIFVMDQLPATATGKILKGRLRDMANGETP